MEMAKKELVQEPKFKCFCRQEFATREALDEHLDSSEPYKAYRDKGYGQSKRKAGMRLRRKFRLITIQLRNAKEEVEAAETGGNSNPKKKGGTGPCKAYRDKGHDQFKRKAGLRLWRKCRLITIQLRNAKEKAEAAETGGNSNAKKKGGTGPWKAYRDKGHDQFKRKAGLRLWRKFRLITIQLRNAKEVDGSSYHD